MADAIMEAPAPAADVVKSGSPPALPSGKGEIKVSEMGKNPLPMRDKGPARARLFADLEKKAVQEPGTEKKPAESPKKEELKPAEQAVKEGEEPVKAPDDKAAADTKAPATPEEKKKLSPWKLVEEYKQKLVKAEADLLETSKRAIPEEKFKAQQTEFEAKNARLKELEEEIKFANFKKSEDYKGLQTKYQGAWSKAMSNLADVKVPLEGGGEADIKPDDLLELVNMTDGKAQITAIERYGDLGNLVMKYRDDIRSLADQMVEAEKTARSEGEIREKTRLEQSQKEYTEVTGMIRETYTKANDEVKTDPKYAPYFTPREGDEQGNQRLAKGYELADRAFSENPMTKGLNADQRQSIVRRHAAVRNRAAAFGRLVYDNQQAQAKIAELEKLVAEYKGTEPKRSGSQPEMKQTKRSGMDGMLDELRKRAKQV